MHPINGFETCRPHLSETGFAVVENLYSDAEIEVILAVIDGADATKATFRKAADLFAIRQFLKELPEAVPLLFNARLRTLLQDVLGSRFFVVKSIYFDKPPASNWYVPYHQDLTISVDAKATIDGFSTWTVKQNQFAVQPPVSILEAITTVRIHLDDTDENNGALSVIPHSHLAGIRRPETLNQNRETEALCAVRKGGIMLMKPLTLHRSGRTTNNARRRVVHIELSHVELPDGLHWAERLELQ
ncbi:MAG: phytanoyl-CoA dioxygenase [Sphingobacteriales bacterium]|nr:MAG: phytanoyl-CoA dioxygenase [Sphingobacteriales bacterium]